MAAFDKFNAAGHYDEAEPPFTETEIEHALDWRQRVWPDPRSRRHDRCPHTPQCASLGDCVEAIAWYFRHRAVLERAAGGAR